MLNYFNDWKNKIYDNIDFHGKKSTVYYE
jgi:hypothetical protein